MDTPGQLGLEDLALMRQGVNYAFTVQIRGWKVALRPIEVGEQMQINREVLEELQNIPPTMRTAMDENFLLAKKILERASMVDPERKQVGSIMGYMLDRMTIDEIMFAYNQYLKGASRVNPDLEDIPPEELKRLVEDVKKNPELLTDLSSWQVLKLARHLILAD